jgi:MinD-like ATPase involved in chromosome partitioning or flagellar assembly
LAETRGGNILAKIISIHSFRGGTGKSNTTANVAALLAADGQRVGVIDTDIQSPGIHILFGLEGENLTTSLNDYLWHGREIKDTAIDMSDRIGGGMRGRLYLIPSSTKPGEIARVLREGYDAQRLTEGLRRLVDELALDVLMIDTHPGLNEETLLSMVISHTLAIVCARLRITRYCHRKSVSRRTAQWIVIRTSLESEAVQIKVEQAYSCEVAAVLPHSDEMMKLASEGLFVMRYPQHPMTAMYRHIAGKLIE